MLGSEGEPRKRRSGTRFEYERAFSRTIGWITAAEQTALRSKRIAIGGMGGVGGAHLLALARLGIQRFTVADGDVFELENFNRQLGASMRTIGRAKVEVMAELVHDINPEAEVVALPGGIDADHVDRFLAGADLFVDGLDLFALEARRLVFAACAVRGIPAITAAPLGMGAALLVFVPGGMTFERYFRLEGHDRVEQVLRFLVGLAPAALHRGYLVDRGTVDLAAGRASSTPMGVHLAAGVAATAALKILLGRGSVLVAPHGIQLDAYENRLRRTWRPGGNANPLQRFTLYMTRRFIGRSS